MRKDTMERMLLVHVAIVGVLFGIMIGIYLERLTTCKTMDDNQTVTPSAWPGLKE